MQDSIDYGTLMHHAMRGLIYNVLCDVKKNGLPGEHHFFITFDTRHIDVKIAQWLSDRYPEEMTIVIQHWFDNLEVSEDQFSITLNFGDTPEPLTIPFDAILTFVDPSVEFGLRFEQHEEQLDDIEDEIEDVEDEDNASQEQTDSHQKNGDVVSLDSFRK